MEWYFIVLTVLGGAAALWLLVTLAVSVGLYRFAIPRKKEAPRPEGELPFERMMRKNKKEHYLPEVQAGVDYMKAHRGEAEEVYVKGDDGTRLHGALFETKDPVGLIVFCHGYHSVGEADFAPMFPFVTGRGYAALLIDHRGHGSSGGRHVTFGVKERCDLRAWLRWAAKRFPGTPLYLWGVSMGAASTLFALELPGLPRTLAGAVADCGYDRPDEEVAFFARTKFRVPLARWFIFFSNFWCRLFAGFSLYACSAARDASKIPCPVMILHGTRDDIVPYENGERIFAALPGKKAFFTGRDALHGCSYLEEPERCRAEIARFLEDCQNAFAGRCA